METNIFLEAIGYTLLHALWQGGIVAALLALFLAFSRRKSALLRYRMAVMAMVAMALWSAGTLWREHSTLASEAAVAEALKYVPARILLALEVDATRSNSPTTHPLWLQVEAWIGAHVQTLSIAWLMGMALCIVRWAGGMWYLRRLRISASEAHVAGWQAQMQRVSSRLALRKKVQLRFSARVSVPMVVGHIKPMVLLPLSLATGLDAVQMEAILAHELAHIRRNDFLINLILVWIEMLFFYHPAFWWMSSRVRAERELCCDELAVAILPTRRVYAETLARLETMAPAPVSIRFAMHLFRQKKELLTRIKHIMLPNQVKIHPMERILPTALLATAIALLLWFNPSPLTAADSPAEEACVDEIAASPAPKPAKNGITSAVGALESVAEEVEASFFKVQQRLLFTIFPIDTPPPAPVMPPMPPAPAMPPMPPMPPADGTNPRQQVFRIDTDGDGEYEVDIAYRGNVDINRELARAQAELQRAHAQVQRELSRVRAQGGLSRADKERMEREMERVSRGVEQEMRQMGDALARIGDDIEREVNRDMSRGHAATNEEEIAREVERAHAEADRAQAAADRVQEHAERMAEQAQGRAEQARRYAEDAQERAEEARERIQERAEADREDAARVSRFEADLRSGLVADGLIGPGDKITLDVDNDQITINGKVLTPEQRGKYQEMLEDALGNVKSGSTVIFKYRK